MKLSSREGREETVLLIISAAQPLGKNCNDCLVFRCVCARVFVRVEVCVCVGVRMFVCMYVCVWVCVHARECMGVCMY